MAPRLLLKLRMSRRRTPTLPLAPRRHPGSQTSPAKVFTALGFVFFRLVSMGAGEPRYAVVRVQEARKGMAVLAAAA